MSYEEKEPEAGERDPLMERLREFQEVEPLHNDHNAIEFFLIALCIFTGISFFFDPPNIDADVDNTWRYLWRILLIFGGSLVCVGLSWWGDVLTSYHLRKMGYLGLGFGALAYGVAAPDFIVLLFGAAVFARAVQLDNDVDRAHPDQSLLRAPIRWVRRLRHRE